MGIKERNFTVWVVLFKARILWIDEKNLTACCESGIIGQDLERRVCTVCFNKKTPTFAFGCGF